MWVIKIGGSLAASPALPAWLSLIAADRTRRWLVVPGGGPYADAVRAQQARWHFGDPQAHRMAVQAMGVYGAQLAAMAPAFATDADVRRLAAEAGSGIWCPGADAAAGLRGLPEDWRTSADSIALWAAQILGARALVLLKSGPPDAADHRAGALAACGYVDEHFPTLLRHRPLPCYWLSATQIPTGMPPATSLDAQRIHPD